MYLLFELMLLLYLVLENPIFPYLSQLLPEFGTNRIKKSVLDRFNGFMLPHILWDHFLFTSLVTKCDFYRTTLFSELHFVAPHVKKCCSCSPT